MALTDEDKHWINDRLDQMESRFKEHADQRSEAIETRLLRAFRNVKHPVEGRLRVDKAVSEVYYAELEALAERVRLGDPPLPRARLSRCEQQSSSF